MTLISDRFGCGVEPLTDAECGNRQLLKPLFKLALNPKSDVVQAWQSHEVQAVKQLEIKAVHGRPHPCRGTCILYVPTCSVSALPRLQRVKQSVKLANQMRS
jgi:hypothetical protein